MQSIEKQLSAVSATQFVAIKVFVALSLAGFCAQAAHAVPSYSRQTGLPCASCHYAPPELNAFGRKFKLEGYTFTTKAEVSDDKKDHNSALHLLEAFPLSAVFDASFTFDQSTATRYAKRELRVPPGCLAVPGRCLDGTRWQLRAGDL